MTHMMEHENKRAREFCRENHELTAKLELCRENLKTQLRSQVFVFGGKGYSNTDTDNADDTSMGLGSGSGSGSTTSLNNNCFLNDVQILDTGTMKW